VTARALDATQIAERVGELAAGLSADYPDGELTLVALLPSGEAFARSLSRALSVPHVLDAIAVSRLGPRSQRALVTRPTDRPVRGRAVVVVDTVADTGLTLHFALRQLALQQPTSMEACVLVDQRQRRLVDDLPLRGSHALR
jgi:hypoxanthine-guanine phosphoribosyltransferase